MTKDNKALPQDAARAATPSGAEPKVSGIAGIANAKSMADIIPNWGGFLDGLAAHLERENPEGWASLVQACEQQPTAQGIEAFGGDGTAPSRSDESPVAKPCAPNTGGIND